MALILDPSGNVIAKLKLDTSDFEGGMIRAGRVADKHGAKIERGWWKRFGAVAIGFTIAYRAMRLFQTGLESLTSQMYDTLKVTDEFEKQVISTSATIVSIAKVDNPFEAYARILPEVRNLMLELELVAAKHLVTADELRMTYAAFVRKRVIGATKEDIANIAVVADAIKVFAEQSGRAYQFQQEIYALVEATTGKGRQLANYLKAIHPDLKAQINAWKQMGIDVDNNNVLLAKMGDAFVGLKAAQGDILRLWTTQLTTAQSLWGVVKRIGGAETYARAVSALESLNNSFKDSTGFSEEMAKWAFVWHSLLNLGYETLKSIKDVLKTIVIGPEGLATILNWTSKWIIGWSTIFGLIAASQRALNEFYMTLLSGKYVDSAEILGKMFMEMDRILLEAGDRMSGTNKTMEDFIDNTNKSWEEILKMAGSIEKIAPSSEKWITALVKAGFEIQAIEQVIHKINDGHFKSADAAERYLSLEKDILNIKTKFSKESDKNIQLLIDETVTLDNLRARYKYLLDEMTQRNNALAESARSTASAMEDAFSSGFFDLAKGEAKEFHDYMSMLLDSLLKQISDYMAALLRAQLFEMPFPGNLLRRIPGVSMAPPVTPRLPPVMLPAPMAPIGMLAPSALPHFHNGLMPDEIPAILQKGETVLPRGVSPSRQSFNINISAIDPKSFSDIIQRNPHAVLGPLIDALQQGDGFVLNTFRSTL